MKDDTEEGLVESAISQLENGILILSAIKDGGSCSQKLACTLGNASKAWGYSYIISLFFHCVEIHRLVQLRKG
jgi:hypothetical protein